MTSAPKLCLWRRNFCAAGDVLLLLQRCDFWTVKKPFPLTTAAQNIHVFLPKLPLHKKHFFGWLKAANFSIVCGTVTLKSPPSRGTDAPRVHPRPRKRLSRCTLDCGFKTSESPAMRGFVAERGQIRGTSLYLVLKSNGPHCSKNLPVKFGFSSKTVPANIVQKLPSQRCSKPFLIPPFNFSHKRPTFALTPESGYTLGLRRKIAHKGSHGETRSFTLVVALRFISHLTFGQAKAEGSGCTPTACVRFLRRRGPAGLCNTLFNLPICISHALRMGISAHARWKRYYYPRRTPHVVETPGARLSKRLIYRFLTVKQELLFARRLFSCE